MDNPISRIRRAPEIIQRYRHILTVLARYGLAHWLDQLPLGFAKDILARGVGEELVEESTEGRVRRALGELGRFSSSWVNCRKPARHCWRGTGKRTPGASGPSALR